MTAAADRAALRQALPLSPDAERGVVVEHLFRHEAGRLAAALVRVLGPANLDLAEDVVQETLCHALEVWKMGRVPDNPAAWLRASARNRALDLLRRQRTRTRLAPEVAQLHGELAPAVDAAFTDDALRVEQLRMMFACCDARLKPAVQVALVLKLLCGFGVDEVAHAFLASPAAIEKRLARGKAALRRAGALADLSDPQLARRLEAVLDALYLLFNEGYHGAHPEMAVRAELCAEAIRLARALAEDPATAQPRTFALLALMCLHAARLPGRLDARGALVPLEEQDRSAWDRALAAEGARWLSRAVSDALRRPVRAASHAGGRPEPRHRAGAGGRAGARARGAAGAARPRSPGALSLLLRGARRAAPPRRARGRGGGGVPPGPAAGPQPRRAPAFPAQACGWSRPGPPPLPAASAMTTLLGMTQAGHPSKPPSGSASRPSVASSSGYGRELSHLDIHEFVNRKLIRVTDVDAPY